MYRGSIMGRWYLSKATCCFDFVRVFFFFSERCAQEGVTCHGLCCVYAPKTYIPTPKIHWLQLFLSPSCSTNVSNCTDKTMQYLYNTRFFWVGIVASFFVLLVLFYLLRIDINSKIHPNCSARLAFDWDTFLLHVKSHWRHELLHFHWA